MSNRRKLIEAIQNCNARLRAEIHYHFYEVEHEEPEYDMADAFDDAASNIEENMPELENVLRDFYISIGYVTEVDTTKVISTGKKYWFKRLGKHYECVTHWEEWIAI